MRLPPAQDLVFVELDHAAVVVQRRKQGTELFGELLVGRRKIVQALQILGGPALVIELAANRRPLAQQLANQRTVVDFVERASERLLDPLLVTHRAAQLIEGGKGSVVYMGDDGIAKPLEGSVDIGQLSVGDDGRAP